MECLVDEQLEFVLNRYIHGGPKLPNRQTIASPTTNLKGTTISLEETTLILEGTTFQSLSICTMPCHLCFYACALKVMSPVRGPVAQLPLL